MGAAAGAAQVGAGAQHEAGAQQRLFLHLFFRLANQSRRPECFLVLQQLWQGSQQEVGAQLGAGAAQVGAAAGAQQLGAAAAGAAHDGAGAAQVGAGAQQLGAEPQPQ